MKQTRLTVWSLAGVLSVAGLGWTQPRKNDQPLPTPGPTKPAQPITPAPSAPPPSQPSPSQPATPAAPAPSAPAAPDAPRKAPAEQVQPGMVDLRPKFKVGQVFKLKIANDAENSTLLNGGVLGDPSAKPEPSLSRVNQEFVLVFKPTAVAEDGQATVDVHFESIAMTVDSDAGKDSFDSTKPAAPRKSTGDPLQDLASGPALEPMLRPLVGDKLTLTVNRNGEVTNVDGGEKFAALFGGAGGALPGIGGGAGAGGGGAKKLFGSIFTVDKTRPQARVGDRWTTQQILDLSMAGSVAMSTTYTLASATPGRAKLNIAGQLQSTAPKPSADMPFSIRECSHSGDCEWNTDDGFVQSMNSGQKLSLEMSIGGLSGSATSTQKTTVRRIP